jgi:hypothetical protein
VQALTPLVLLALAAPIVIPRGFALLGLVFSVVTAGVYLLYLVSRTGRTCDSSCPPCRC